MSTSRQRLRILALVTDAFGGRGGIAQANRDLLTALALDPGVAEVVVVPRVVVDDVGDVPPGIDFRRNAAGGPFRFFRELIRALVADRDFDLILCGHVHLVPAAWLARNLTRGARTALVIHGIEAWHPTGRLSVDSLIGSIDSVIAVSDFTRRRFVAWSDHDGPSFVLPNCVHLERWHPGGKPADLVERYGLEDRKVLMTLGRMVSRERAKGFDEVIEVLADLVTRVQDLVYLAAGDGPDHDRLEWTARELGVADRVIFTGYVPEQSKNDFYRLADLFVMPSRGEGFGIVLLEALGCGVPVIASCADGTREAVLDGRLGRIVDPGNPAELRDAIVESLATPPEIDRDLLATFDFEELRKRLRAILEAVIW